MATKIFTPEQFTATVYDQHSGTNQSQAGCNSRKEKADFANQFAKFVKGGFKREDFSKSFYKRLSMTFGHIAHRNQEIFYEYFFDCDESKKEFMSQTMAYPCYGDPEWTYSDVEKALQAWIIHAGLRD